MGPITIVFGVVLTALGLIGYVATGAASWTALIPAFFGLPLLALGFLARREHLRKHVMHAAAAIGLFGFLGAAIMAVPDVPQLVSQGKVIKLKTLPDETTTERDATMAVVMTLVMGLICAVFVGLCIKSFIDARVARSRRAAEGFPQT